jgi:hypothetical protein
MKKTLVLLFAVVAFVAVVSPLTAHERRCGGSVAVNVDVGNRRPVCRPVLRPVCRPVYCRPCYRAPVRCVPVMAPYYAAPVMVVPAYYEEDYVYSRPAVQWGFSFSSGRCFF